LTLYRRGNIWWSRIEIDKTVHQFSTKATSKHTARQVEAAHRTELVKGRAGLRAPTLFDFSKQFINSLPDRVSRETFRFYVGHFRALWEFPALGQCQLDRINMALVEDFIQWRRKQGVSVTTVNHNLRTLRRALHLAAEWNVIAKVPKVKLLPGELQRDYVLSEQTVERFTREPQPMCWLVPFLVDTGLRRAEICNLLWDNVNFSERWIFITRGKSKYARRRIPLTKRAEKILHELPRACASVFSVRDRKMTGNWISRAFLRTRRKLKLPDDCVLHSTRHTFCTRLGEKGADAFAIQRLAGHSSIVISQRYVHPAAARLDAAIALLE